MGYYLLGILATIPPLASHGSPRRDLAGLYLFWQLLPHQGSWSWTATGDTLETGSKRVSKGKGGQGHQAGLCDSLAASHAQAHGD